MYALLQTANQQPQRGALTVQTAFCARFSASDECNLSGFISLGGAARSNLGSLQET
jgi:hypothetical protein